MTDHKYTDEEVIKALECCSTYSCDGCPYRKFATDCVILLPQNALDLVERQKAEIEKLESLSERLGDDVTLKLKYIYELEERLAIAKAEAIKEFAERLVLVEETTAINCATNERVVRVMDINTLVKAMTEVKDESQNT